GLIVRHHELGYKANAMTVWNIDDDKVAEVGRCFGKFDFVTLCYRRPRRLPDWPYNLFCMVHGQERDAVLEQVEQLAEKSGAAAVGRDVLFSTRRFKQRGARYGKIPEKMESVA
ncbi:MAG TPA: AsnC family protein, partial [Rhodospirillales bacterium]|nr:AsnC family protein [Rhodospirillales bacterium]